MIAVSLPSVHPIPSSPFSSIMSNYFCTHTVLYIPVMSKICTQSFSAGFHMFVCWPGLCSHFIVFLFPFIMASYCKLFLPEHFHPLAWPLRKKSILHLVVSRRLVHSWASVTSMSSIICSQVWYLNQLYRILVSVQFESVSLNFSFLMQYVLFLLHNSLREPLFPPACAYP